ncbi:NADH-quinone oxidoreductase subunit E [Hydrogenispora ethanolica]|jgi:NADH-quinone oxidoreductase subunit E|uniref:NADH-quinone oxidoreductase subunit E n=1 Tax=Hydrogenispora ethanolica TaxID=1082276 RepID=A0A4R1R1L6_HYDET|nr:NADH-quinone oxidoreductase subunit NuoE [Hydrogenispora ethanolica]TCL59225.1 NADH-quinone oxidoreductase subunit E [Hydrogenispora ethanolica]
MGEEAILQEKKTRTDSSLLPRRRFERVNEIIDAHGKAQSALIPILQEVQEEYRYLPEEILTYIATVMGLSPATVFGVATFYAQFSLEPKGKYVVKICDGTACHVRGSDPVKEAIRKRVGLTGNKLTTDDLRFTVETVSCLGACGLAPVVMINEQIYGQMTPDAITIILDRILAEEGEGR